MTKIKDIFHDYPIAWVILGSVLYEFPSFVHVLGMSFIFVGAFIVAAKYTP